MVDIVGHKELVVFQLLDGRHVALDPAGGRLHRELDDLGGGIVGILPHLGQHRVAQLLAHAAEGIGGGDAHPADIIGRMGVVHAAGHRGQQGQRALGLDGGGQQRLGAPQPGGNLRRGLMGSLPEGIQELGLGFLIHGGGVDHVLPAGEGAADEPVALLHQVPPVHLQIPAGHPVASPRRQTLGVQELGKIQLAVLHKGHDVHRGEVTKAVAVEQNLAAGVAAVEVLPALFAGFLVDPAGLAGVAHLLEVPVELLPGGLLLIVDGVVAHLPVGDGLVDLPAAGHIAVELALGLDARLVVGVDEADLRGAPHAAGDHVLADDVGDVQ